MDRQLLGRDFRGDLAVFNAVIYDNRSFIEEWLRGNDTTNEAFLNELLRKAARHGSKSVVELLATSGETIALSFQYSIILYSGGGGGATLHSPDCSVTVS